MASPTNRDKEGAFLQQLIEAEAPVMKTGVCSWQRKTGVFYEDYTGPSLVCRANREFEEVQPYAG